MEKETKPTVQVRIPASHLVAVRAAHKRHQEAIGMMNDRLAYSLPDMTAVVNTLTFPKINLFGDIAAAIQATQPRLDFINTFLHSPGIQGMLDNINALGKAAESMLTFDYPVCTPVASQDDIVEEEVVESDIAVPTVFEQVQVNMEHKMLSCLPENAQLLDEYIAIDSKNHIFFRIEDKWMPHAIGKQAIRTVQYLQAVASTPNKRLVSITELTKFSKGGTSARTKRTTISNRLLEVNNLCDKYGCKPITIISARKRCLNPELSYCKKFRWDTP